MLAELVSSVKTGVSLMILIRTIGVIVRGHHVGAKLDFSEFCHRHDRVLGRLSV